MSPSLHAILFALQREAAPFLRRRRCRRVSAPFPAWDTDDALVLVTGVGPAAARAACAWLLPQRPASVIAAGFAGALSPELSVGTVIEASAVLDERGTVYPCAGANGRLLSLPRLVGDPAEKRQLGQLHAAVAVDMESAAIAACCQEAGVPFAAVRAISDGVDTALSPRLLGLLVGGRVRPGKLTAALLRQPTLVRELLRLARDTRRAAVRLAEVLAARSHG